MRECECGADDFVIFVRLRDEMVSGQHSHQRIALCDMAHVKSSEGDRGGGVAADGLCQNAFPRSGRKLFFYGGSLLSVRNGPGVVGRDDRPQPSDGLLEHRVFPDDVQQLLGGAGAATGPEARAATACENHRMSLEFFHTSRCFPR